MIDMYSGGVVGAIGIDFASDKLLVPCEQNQDWIDTFGRGLESTLKLLQRIQRRYGNKNEKKSKYNRPI